MLITELRYEEIRREWEKYYTKKSAGNPTIYKVGEMFLVSAQSYGYEWYVGFGKDIESAIMNMKFYDINMYSKSDPLNDFLLYIANGKE